MSHVTPMDSMGGCGAAFDGLRHPFAAIGDSTTDAMLKPE
jgi:hypothetical protein